MSNFRRPKHLTTRRMQETRPNPPKEQAKAQRPAREIRWNCPVAAKCGGCQLTRLSYAEQLQWKQQRVAELLDGICEVRPILGMDDPFHYRNKVHAVLAVDKAGRPISGVYAMGTHRVVPVRHCLIEDRRLQAAHLQRVHAPRFPPPHPHPHGACDGADYGRAGGNEP